MEANGPLSRLGAKRSGGLLASRRSSLLVAAVSAILAATLIYIFVSHYRTQSAPVAPLNETVFVAKQYIPAGTPYSEIASQGLLEPKTVPSTKAVVGAISDPSEITGQVSSAAIAPGQQVTTLQFNPSAKVTISSYLTGDYRAVAFSLDNVHGLTNFLQAGQFVDVMGTKSQNGAGKTKLLAQNVEVISVAPGDLVLKLTDKQGLAITAATSGSYSLWLTLRPATGSKQTIKVGDLETVS